MSNFIKYIAFYAKPGQGFLFPQEVLWLQDNSSVKRPTLEEYKNIKNTKQIFVGAVPTEKGDLVGWNKLLVSDLEAIEVTEEYSVILPLI